MKKEEIMDYLLRLSEAKLLLVNKLFKNTEAQSKTLEPEKMQEMEIIIQEKQEIMGKIDIVDKEFVEKYAMLKKLLGITSLQELEGEEVPALKELQKKIGEIVKIIEEVQKLDEGNTEKMKRNIAEAKNNFKAVKAGKKVTAGYKNQYIESHSFFIDKKK
ncbi:flagellar export chaperone FlgN [Natronincola ferrireducens]|uniref:FlgN protein n=1 Tax=Natronincola ferrireducens TaxID=393762 RepID=A0A1G8XQL7_9FIRM|nr:flagellar export chaperone FlgN [Natronincola ferrireducens]SDJ92891.1 FlgN protein [Natronincola ferrireducens]